MNRGPVLWLALAACAVAPLAASAQCAEGTATGDVVCVFRAPRWAGEFASLSANGALGGLTAGLAQRFRGGSFADGFVRGLFGGALTWAGKWTAARRFDGAGLAGRQIAAAGASAVRNASEGRALLGRLMLPVGPIWLDVRRGPSGGVGARLDVAAAGWLIYGLAAPELRLDAGASVSSGAFVFRTDGRLLDLGGGELAAGLTNAGVVYLADVPAYGAAFRERALAHERIHVLQEDQFAIQWTDPAVGWAFDRLELPAAPNRFLAWNLSAELFGLLGGVIPDHRNRPWELEATFHAR